MGGRHCALGMFSQRLQGQLAGLVPAFADGQIFSSPMDPLSASDMSRSIVFSDEPPCSSRIKNRDFGKRTMRSMSV